MKNTISLLYNQLDLAEVKLLTTVADETLAKEFDHSRQIRVFSSIDLWNIQRNKKSLHTRKYSL